MRINHSDAVTYFIFSPENNNHMLGHDDMACPAIV
jgi:hypothetical protein